MKIALANRQMGSLRGAPFFRVVMITHCNTGSLATAVWYGVWRVVDRAPAGQAEEGGVSETRPYLQARV